MSDYNWCHGPDCHKKHTVDRVRGVKGSKVLRTRKIKTYNGNRGWYNFFCSQGCYDDFANKYIQEVIAIAPRTECLETPIDVVVDNCRQDWRGNDYKTKVIKEVDNNLNP